MYVHAHIIKVVSLFMNIQESVSVIYSDTILFIELLIGGTVRTSVCLWYYHMENYVQRVYKYSQF